MEGVLEKYESVPGTLYNSDVWKRYYFILHQEVLMFTEVDNKANIIGKIHMQISQVRDHEESEFIIDSGTIELRL